MVAGGASRASATLALVLLVAGTAMAARPYEVPCREFRQPHAGCTKCIKYDSWESTTEGRKKTTFELCAKCDEPWYRAKSKLFKDPPYQFTVYNCTRVNTCKVTASDDSGCKTCAHGFDMRVEIAGRWRCTTLIPGCARDASAYDCESSRDCRCTKCQRGWSLNEETGRCVRCDHLRPGPVASCKAYDKKSPPNRCQCDVCDYHHVLDEAKNSCRWCNIPRCNIYCESSVCKGWRPNKCMCFDCSTGYMPSADGTSCEPRNMATLRIPGRRT